MTQGGLSGIRRKHQGHRLSLSALSAAACSPQPTGQPFPADLPFGPKTSVGPPYTHARATLSLAAADADAGVADMVNDVVAYTQGGRTVERTRRCPRTLPGIAASAARRSRRAARHLQRGQPEEARKSSRTGQENRFPKPKTAPSQRDQRGSIPAAISKSNIKMLRHRKADFVRRKFGAYQRTPMPHPAS